MGHLNNIPVLNIDKSFSKGSEGFHNKRLVFDSGEIKTSMPEKIWKLGYIAYELHYLERKEPYSNILRKAEKPVSRWLASYAEKLLIRIAEHKPPKISEDINNFLNSYSEEVFLKKYGSAACHLHRLKQYTLLLKIYVPSLFRGAGSPIYFYYPQLIFSSLEWMCYCHQNKCFDSDLDAMTEINELLEVCKNRLKSLTNNKVRHSKTDAEKEILWAMYLEGYQDRSNADAARQLSRKEGIKLTVDTIRRFLGKRKKDMQKINLVVS